jgi:hypothetical protein
VATLNYQIYIDEKALSHLTKMMLSISSSSLKIGTDIVVYYIGIRGVKVMFSEYDQRQRL